MPRMVSCSQLVLRASVIPLQPALCTRLRWAPLIPKQAFEARRRQFGITNRVLDRFMPEIGLDRAGIDALVRQLKSAGVPQHVWVDLHIEASGLTSAF